jgi:hypothetical protein
MSTLKSAIIESGWFVGKKHYQFHFKRKTAPIGAIHWTARAEGTYPGHEWAWDFIHDWALKGGRCRM